MVPPPHARNLVDQPLAWIRFGIEGSSKNIRDEGGLEEFDDFFGLTVSNILNMDSSFSKRTTDQVSINFGMRCANYNLGIMHWDQDESCCSITAYLPGIFDAKE